MKGEVMKTNAFWMALLSLSIIIILAACGEKATPTPVPTLAPPPTAEPTLTKEPTHTAVPTATPVPTATTIPTPTPWPILAVAKVSNPLFTVEDPDSSIVWWEKRVIYGDNFYENQLERPFTSKEMVYQPDIDIIRTSIANDDKFYYFTITMRDVDKTSKTLSGNYGIEFDRTKTGRGDFLVWVHDLKDQWSSENIKVFVDLDKDIGGPNPSLANAGFKGNGYESEVKIEEEKVAYARVMPGTPWAMQIAVSRLLLDNATEFLWNAWADKGLNDPGKFDYNDHFTFREAGSPIKTIEVYPLAALYSVDNTCRKPFGFSPKGYIPGTCLASAGVTGTGSTGGSCVPVCLMYDPTTGNCYQWSTCP